MDSFGKALGLAIALLIGLAPADATADRARARAQTTEGQNRAEQGRPEEALLLYEKAIRSDPDYHASYELAIPLWMRFGKLKEAQSTLEILTLRCRDCSFAWYALGALYRKGGRFDLAVLAYEIYLAKRPLDPDAHFGLAMALGAQKDAQAPLVLRRYLQLERRPDREAYRLQASKLLASLTGEASSPAAIDWPISKVTKQSTDLQTVQALIASGHLVSAESLLDQRYDANADTLALRLQIASARGDWFQKASYSALLWLWR